MNKVGTKGQVVITKEIRDKLGIGPGWLASQRVVDGHVEINFIPPRHNRSLLGAARPHIHRWPDSDEDWEEKERDIWAEAVDDRFDVD